MSGDADDRGDDTDDREDNAEGKPLPDQVAIDLSKILAKTNAAQVEQIARAFDPLRARLDQIASVAASAQQLQSAQLEQIARAVAPVLRMESQYQEIARALEPLTNLRSAQALQIGEAVSAALDQRAAISTQLARTIRPIVDLSMTQAAIHESILRSMPQTQIAPLLSPSITQALASISGTLSAAFEATSLPQITEIARAIDLSGLGALSQAQQVLSGLDIDALIRAIEESESQESTEPDAVDASGLTGALDDAELEEAIGLIASLARQVLNLEDRDIAADAVQAFVYLYVMCCCAYVLLRFPVEVGFATAMLGLAGHPISAKAARLSRSAFEQMKADVDEDELPEDDDRSEE